MKALTVTKNFVTSKGARTLLKTQKHSPIILFTAGTIGVIGTAVMASKATLKLEETLDHHDKNREKAQQLLDEHLPTYTAQDFANDINKIKVRTIVDVTKLYGPTILVGTASIAALTGSHVILNRRYAGAVAAYSALDKAFTEYRAKVIDKLGEDEERKLRLEVQDDITVNEDGSLTVTTGRPIGSPYARLFARDTTLEWSKDDGYNLTVLRTAEKYCNDRLKAVGHLWLNEAYRSLGLSDTKAGAVTGWVYDNERGDQYVDFGFRGDWDRVEEFLADADGAIWLDFNVDGQILDLI